MNKDYFKLLLAVLRGFTCAVMKYGDGENEYLHVLIQEISYSYSECYQNCTCSYGGTW